MHRRGYVIEFPLLIEEKNKQQDLKGYVRTEKGFVHVFDEEKQFCKYECTKLSVTFKKDTHTNTKGLIKSIKTESVKTKIVFRGLGS
jgi:hypothetical protein